MEYPTGAFHERGVYDLKGPTESDIDKIQSRFAGYSVGVYTSGCGPAGAMTGWPTVSSL